MVTSDPLFFLTEQPVSNNAGATTTPTPVINPVHFILNVVFVLVILYLTLLLIRLVYRKTGISSPTLLKETPLGQTGKLQYIKVGEKLYLLAQNGTQMIHLDTITDQKTILELLNEIKDGPDIPTPFTWGTLLGWFRRNKSVEIEPEQFDTTLKKISQNSNKLEDLNKK
jgi:flagellar biogenesis protein FliO